MVLVETEKDHLEPGSKGWTWEKSLSKAMLVEMIWNGRVTARSQLGMRPRDVWDMAPMFQEELQYRLFADRLRALRTTILREQQSIDEAVDGYQRDRHLYPMTTHDSVGRPHWQGSGADKLVKAYAKTTFVDVLGGSVHHKHLRVNEKKLYLDNYAVCRDFELRVFIKHIDQEIRTLKWYNSRNKMGLSKKSRK
jgi:hypothetical protein